MTATPSYAILIVDDEEGIRELLKDEFELFGMQVSTAINGTKAFEAIQKNKFDIVLSDIRMPGGDGVTLFRNVQTLPEPRPAFFLMSGFSDMTREQAISEGAKDLFAKPFDLDAVYKTVMQHLQK